MPKQHGSVGDSREFNSLGQIGAAEFCLCFTHSVLSDVDAVDLSLPWEFPTNCGLSGGDPRNSIIGKESLIVCTIDRSGRVVGRTALDLLAIDVEMDHALR